MTNPSVVSAIPTAFHPDGALDLPGTEAIIRRVRDADVDMVFVNGTTAEFPSLDREERASTVEAALSIMGPERVIAHVGASSAWEAASLTRDALERGATSIAAITPYFFPASLSTVRSYFAAIRSVAPETDLYAYLFPDRTSVQLSPRDTAMLALDFGLRGVKVSIPGIAFVSDLVGLLPAGISVYSGNDRLISSIHDTGGTGVVSGVSSAVPTPFIALSQSVGDEDATGEVSAQAIVDVAVDTLGPSIARIKLMLKLQGVIGSDSCRMALDPPNDAVIEQVTSLYASLKASSWV